MVKCEGLKEDGSPCQFELLPVFKVCPICGRPTISPPQEDPPDDAIVAVPCPYRGNDGQICGNKIVQNQRFCENCGWRINPKIFQSGSRMCSGVNEMTKKPCDNIILPTTRFCSECGRPPDFDMNEEVTTLPEQERDASNAQSSHDTKAVNGVGAPEPDEASPTNLAVTHHANLSKNSVLENTESKDTGTQNVPNTEETPSELHVQQTSTESMDNSWFRVRKDDLTEHGPWLSTQQQSMLPGPSMSDNSNAVKFPVQASDGSTVDREAYQGQHDPKNWVMVTSPQEIQSSEGTANLTENNISDGPSPAAVTIPHDTETNMGDIVPDNKMEGSQTSSVPRQPSNGSASVTIDESEITIEIYEKEPKNLDKKVVVQMLTPVIQQIESLDVRNSSDPDKAITEQPSAEHDQTIGKNKETKAPVQESSSSAPKGDGDADGNAVDHNEGQNEEKIEDEIVVISADDSEDSDTEEELDDKAGTEGQQRKDRKHRGGKRKKGKEKYMKKKLRKENRQSDTSQNPEPQEVPKKKPETKKKPEPKEEQKKITIKRLDESVKTIPFATSAHQSTLVPNKENSKEKDAKNEKTNKDGQDKREKPAAIASTDNHPLQSSSTTQTNEDSLKRSQEDGKNTNSGGKDKGTDCTAEKKQDSNKETPVGEKGSSLHRTNQKDEEIIRKGKMNWQKPGVQTRNMASQIQVHLQVLVPAEFITTPSQNPAVHIFDPATVFHSIDEMDVTGRDDKNLEVSVTIPIARAHSKRLRYNYLMYCNVSGQREYEFFYDGRFPKMDNYRLLMVPDHCKDQWFQFDGVIQRKPEPGMISSFFTRVTGIEFHEKKMKEDCKNFVYSYFPRWVNFFPDKGYHWTGTEMLEMFSMLEHGLKRTYFMTTKIWNRDENKFSMSLGKIFSEILDTVLLRICSSDEPDIIALIGYLCLYYRYSLSIDKSNKVAIFKALLLKPDYVHRTCPQFDRIKEQFKDDIPLVQEGLMKLIRSMKESDNSVWLYCIPLFHFLMEKSGPFQPVSYDESHDASKPTWWGNVEIQEELGYLKGKSSWKIPVTELLQELKPLFEADYLLPRTFLASLTLDNYSEAVVQAVPMEVILAGLIYHVRKYNIDDKRMKIVYMCLETCQERLLSNFGLQREQIIGNVMVHSYLTVKTASVLLKEVITRSSSRTGLVVRVIDCFLKALAIYEIFYEKIKETSPNMPKHSKALNYLAIFEEKRKQISQWLERFDLIGYGQKDDLEVYVGYTVGNTVIQSGLAPDDITYVSNSISNIYLSEPQNTVWNRVLITTLPESTVRTSFLREIKEKLQDTMFARRDFTKEKFVDLYCEHLDEFCTHVQDILGKVVFELIEKGCVMEDAIMKGKGSERYGYLLSSLFERSWKKRNLVEPTSILEFTLSWPSFAHFIKMFYQGDKSELLSDECNFQLTQAASLVKGTLESLMDGSIMIEDLNIVLANEKGFISTTQIMSEKEKIEFKEDFVRKTIQLRDKELAKFREVKSLVDGLIDACQHIHVDTSDLENSIRVLEKMDKMRVHEICTPGTLDKIQNLNDHEPTIMYFKIGEEILSELPMFLKCCKGMVFMGIWGKMGEGAVRNRDDLLSVEEMMEGVWQPAYEEWNDLGEKIRTGNITFREFYKHFKDYENSIIKRELRPFIVGDQNIVRWIDERLEQVDYQRVLEKCVDGARIILDVVETYDLQGDFSQIVLIEQMAEGEEMKMCDMNRSMIETCNLLRGMEIKQFNCLKEFISARPLVIWLRESMESLKELKVFVDLASISAGEGAMEVDKVKCLHAATTGYAPLIFNLGQECDCDRFLEKCKEVWRELASDPGLPKKLYDTHRELEWLKTVKKSHGSVEVTSMYQAEAINTVGIYRVGNITPGKQTTELTLNEVLELHVQEDEEGSRLRRKYDYKELHELQSKLMLVAGKAEQGKDDVDKFTLVLDSVVRLCNVYIKLVSAGCVLFTDWTARFLCDPDRKVCTFLRFAVDEGTQLKGRRSDTEDLGTIIPSLAKFMETCLEERLKYIDEKREQYPLLNFFTIDQMVILQRELVKVGQDSEPSKLVYPLLCAVKRDCTKSDLITAMRQAKEDVEGKTMEVDVDDENVNEGNVEMDDEDGLTSDEVSKEAIFIEEMVKAGYSEGLAKKALQCTDADEIDQGIAWCMEHEDEVDMEVQSEVMDAGDMGGTSVDNEEVFEGWSTTGKSISSVTQDLLDSLKQDKREVQDENLVRDLQLLWNTFLSSISSSVDDYLSVEHLGLILQRLSQLESFQIERTFLPCFDVGVPNLLMCPQEEVLNTVISIYGHDNDQPLPQADEVLLCTPHTSLDELDIFMRRAIFNGGGRVHCLVNGDALDYEVSDKGERRLEKHMQNAKDQGIEYKLVVICCTEQEYRSRIVAALDKYRKPALPLMASEDIRNYILQKLAVENIVGSAKPAASVDFQKSSVRVVKSWRAGVGKTLYKQRMAEKIETLMMSSRRQTGGVITIPLHEREINVNEIMRILLEHTLRAGSHEPRLFHIDIYHEVQVGVDAFLFQLLILGCLTDSSGYVWRKLPCDLYLIETMPLLARDINMTDGRIKCMHKCFDILPDVICRSPQESLDILNGRKPADYQESDLLFDEKEFRGAVFQRPYQYLLRLDRRQNLSDVAPDRPEGDKVSCLQILLRHCGIRDPSWSELKHFVRFLNSQLSNFETSAYCSLAAAEDLPGFAQFVLRFLIQMSRDFATRSLQISEESTFQTMQRMETDDDDENVDETLQGYQMRRTWESSPHPYLFFNPDGHSLTFLGFNINRQSGDLVDTQTGQVLERAIMQNTLQQALHRNRVNLSENFDGLPRGEKIGKLCSVMGTEFPHDPDETYELTTDNVKKILAIYMRFRCDIPVIIMGETGCGKTRLIKFMCSLQSPPGVEVQNMVLMKVHGGTTSADILRKVEEAERKAQENMEQYGRNMFTVLFFDEANTTEAIGIIKEIMCDHSMAGKPIRLCNNLKIVAACNPYRKHSEELIKRLEQAGLGYHVDADKTTDRLGRVPMRRLVYRVQPLPQSMLPLVWDFGQLDTRVEEMYIKQMVLRYIRNGRLPPGIETVVSKILTVSQDFMRKQEDECSFVSLRDVERVLEVMGWFYQQSDGRYRTILFDLMNGIDDSESEEEFDDEDEAFIDDGSQNLDVVTRSLILALGVCYHACLKNRREYRVEVSQHFSPPCSLPGGEQQMLDEITDCQDIFLDNVQLEQKNIARNQALKENLFMMVVCIELRIPLFLVGKPGSSKSLAKTIVTDAMQGNAAHKELFRYYKQVQMVSFQCSPLSVPEGIVGTFRQCAMYQKDKDLDRFVSVVVLDEVGLAEDSPRMPLKTLHPLLEDGCQGDETPEPYKKVAFIGISNWALDPAKMNRGILVQREVPDREDLKETAMGICSTERKVQKMIKPLIEPMADSYLELFNKVKSKREFFGLRDFYSLLKMVYGFAAKYKKKPTWLMLKHSIMRNFGGFKDLDPVEVFQQKMTAVNKVEQPTAEDPDCSAAGLIQACLSGDSKESETRYLLLLTENYGALTVLQQKILTINNTITIFGSSFPSDQEYTQVCRNINRIKVCMETGSTVVLLNLENLYESLYDALNQYYVYFGGERYVDLGLGTHRVKCRVHKEFRLIVVAEKDIVYNKFPIPLINRLEKHFLTISNMLTPFQLSLADRLTQWAEDFAKAHVQTYQVHTRGKRQKYTVGDVFMGYHADTCASIILHVSSKFTRGKYEQHEEEIFDSAKRMLLWCATPDSLLRLQSTKLSSSTKELNEIYYKEQKHDSLLAYLKLKLRAENSSSLFAQVTTHSKLLSTSDVGELSYFLSVSDITLLTLQSFDTEQQFCRQIRNHLEHHKEGESILIVQCDCGDQNSGLVACARYCIQDEINQQGEQLLGRIHVVFVIQLPRIAGGCFNGFQCGLWHSVHIDELRPPDSQMPTLEDMRRETVGALLDAAPYNISRSQEGENIDVEMSEETQDTEMSEEKLPVGVDDVVLIDEHPRAGQVPIVRKFNIGRLIFTCIHAALAKVKDTDRESARNTERVKILLNLLHQKTTSGDKTFLSGLTSHLASLMKEKEEKLSAHSSTHWLEALATKADDISRAGTFRKTLDQCLADKVTPLLAGIIAYLDTNKNLDVLASSDEESWKRKLWLQVINTTAATQIQYSMLMSPNQLQELQEFMVRGTKHDGHTFSALMPFSWLIFGLIEGILKTSREMDGFGDGLSKVKRASEIIRELPLGMLLTGTQGNIQEMVMAYISDFVYMVYPVTSTQEHQLVCENLHHGTLAILGQEIDGVISLYVGIHVAYHTASPRLTNYSYIQSVWPDCSTAIIETQQKNPHFFLISEDEFTLDVMGLDLMLKNLVPSKEGLNTVQGRSSWVRLVHKYRPVVERILGYFTEKAQDDESNIGPKCLQGVENIRKQWTRVIVMKLFIEHVCTTDEHSLTVKRCMPFWIMLKEDVDLKNLKSVETVEKFLKLCNKDAVSQFFGKQENCRACESVIEERPVTLPCGHVVCLKCFNDTKIILKTYECPVCSEKFPEDFETSDEDKDRAKLDQYNDYRKRCNSFFMEVVSQLCFAHGTPPSVDVIKKLLNYITRQPRKGEGRRVTKELSVFDDGLDPNPVFRSFLLQLMIRTSTEDVTEHLESYFEEAQDMIKEGDDNDSHLVDLSLLVIQCLEDSYHNEAAKMEKPGSAEIKMATNLLTHNTNRLMVEELSVNKLYCLAEIRYSLTIAAKYLHENLVITKKTQKKKLDPHVRRLLDAAGKLCEECGSKWPKVFFVKYICRYYGTEVYQEIHKMKEASITRWVTIPELHQNKVVECSDRYIVCGDTYKTIREKLTHAALNSDAGKLQKALQASNRQQNGQTQIVTILALYREVTLSNLYPEQQRRFPKQAMDVIKQCLTEHDLFKSQTQFVGVLCDNTLWRHVPYLNIAEGMDLRVQNTICLIIHVLVTLIYLPGETTLIEPLRRIATQPQRMKNAMLPTMPQDDVAEIKEALLAARGQNGGDNNPMFYRCPNGHPYVIGDCGRPYYEGKCKECGAKIGGQNHEAFPGNVKVEQWLDQTQTGHILGRADHRKTQAIPERKMTSAHCAVLRLLTHVAMFLGANENPQAILEMIKPDIDPPSVYNFLWSHIEVDITTLRNLLGKSTDDVILLLHHICQQILENHGHGERKNEEMCGLMNKEERGKWEDKFCKKFLAKPLQEFEKKLKDLNKAVLDDQRLGSDPLLCLLFETDSPAETIPNTCLHGNPAVWRYRAKISMEHLSNAFKTQMSFKQPVLRIFLEEEHHLRAIRMVPSIIKLQKFLVQRYQRKLAKAEATTLTIAEMVEQLDSGEGQVDDVEMLIHDFTEAWDSVRENLLKFTLPTSLGIATVPKEYCRRPIDYSSSVSQLLPSQKEAGLCSYGLLYFLLKKQNSFLEKYCKLKKIIEKNVHRVQLSELTAAHLISYHPEHDILPMVLANCNYSFEVGQGTKIEYNFRDFERQLTDRFLFSKSFVDIPVQQFEMMTYRSESTNAVVFERLREKIGQEPLSAAVRHQICEEFRSYTDLCDCLDRLDITISFLKSVGCGEDVKIEYFMTQTLKMENPIPSQKARQSSLCRHVQSLWLTLAMQKTKNQASYKHDTFEGVGDELREDLTEEQREVVRGFCEELQLEKLEVLLETLWECIMLRISVPQNPDDEDYIDTTKFSLRDVMIGYMDNPGYSTELDFPDWLKELTNRMPESDSPNTILASQAVDSWLFLYSLYGQKSQERRY